MKQNSILNKLLSCRTDKVFQVLILSIMEELYGEVYNSEYS